MHTRYSYRVEWSSEDEAYVARCVEFPSLAAHGATPGAALAEIEEVTAEAVKSIIEEGETPPEPFGEMEFKGNILFRTTRDLHRELAYRAQVEGTSINQLLNSLVTRNLFALSIHDDISNLERALARIVSLVSTREQQSRHR